MKSGFKKVCKVAAVAALTGAALGVTGVDSASAGTSKGHLMLGVVPSSQWTGTTYAYPHSVSFIAGGSEHCYKVSAGAWTTTDQPGTFSGAITLYTSSDCGSYTQEIGTKNVPADKSSNDNYWYSIDQSGIQPPSWG